MMLPKEHGAYGQVLFPLITALAIGRPGVAALSLAAAAMCAFVAHEPLLVLLGQRGARARREQHRDAVRWFVAFASMGVVLGAMAIVLMPAAARASMIAPAALAAMLAGVIFTGREHTTMGEVLSAITLSALALPLAIACGAPATSALTCAVVFAVGFVAATVCVRAVITSARKPPAVAARAAGVIVAALVIGVLAWLRSRELVAAIAPWAAAPLSMGGIALAAAPPSARQLRVVGWTLVATTAITSLVLIVALR